MPAPLFLRVNKPEDIRLIDPAVGSGHMLTYAFDLLALIYEEEGYAPSEIPALILRHNLHGVDICPRAAQLAELALVFKAREKSRRFLQPGNLVRPRILAMQDVVFEEAELTDYIAALDLGGLFNKPVLELLSQFEHATTFGALIQPCLDEQGITALRAAIEAKDLSGQLFLSKTHEKVLRVLEQAEALTQRYHVVVANPPYMGGKGMNPAIKRFLQDHFADYKSDLFSAFIVRSLSLALSNGYLGFMSPFVWMFISSYEDLRNRLITEATITSLVQLEYSGFDGATVPICTFALQNKRQEHYRGGYIRLSDFRGSENQSPKTLEAISNPECGWFFRASADEFLKIPGCPIAYWVSSRIRQCFATGIPLREVAEPCAGLQTGDNGRFLRLWHEVSRCLLGLRFNNRQEANASRLKWFPYNKGGEFRRWFGNNEYVVNWSNDGDEIANFRPNSVIRNPRYYFQPALTWSFISSSFFGVRYSDSGFLFDVAGSSAFPPEHLQKSIIGFLCSKIAFEMMKALNPTMNFQVGNVATLPFLQSEICVSKKTIDELIHEAIGRARADWDNFETSWDFRDLPLLRPELKVATLEASWSHWEAHCTAAIRRMQELETENNRLFIEAYGLTGELTPEVPEDQITLARADRRKDVVAFLSYAVGCMMGRYSLDHPGLILANAGDSLREFLDKVGKPMADLTFTPDEDGILPVLDGEWFEDDIVSRTRDFLRATFGEATLAENLRFIEEALGKDLRKYFLTDFYKDHLSNERAYGYKKRPIYWLFTSGKKGFSALVYLHRYTKDTVNRLLNGYLREYLHKLRARIEHLEHVSATSTNTREKTSARKEGDALKKTLRECEDYERDTLLPLAQARLELDLDDGVKVNYLKLGEALAPIAGLAAKEED